MLVLAIVVANFFILCIDHFIDSNITLSLSYMQICMSQMDLIAHTHTVGHCKFMGDVKQIDSLSISQRRRRDDLGCKFLGNS